MTKPLSETRPLSLLISSRCNDKVPYQDQLQPLGVLRRVIKERLQAITLGGRQVFEVWIHEDESNASGLVGNWEVCKQKSREADVFIMLYNGRAGWLGRDSPVNDGVGICHAELSAAYNRSPAKVRSIQFKALVAAAPDSPDAAFQAYVSHLKLPGAQVTTGEEALVRVEELAAAVVLGLAREGVGQNSSGGYYAGEALEWSRLNFQSRRRHMTDAVAGLLKNIDRAVMHHPSGDVAAVRIQGTTIGFVCDAIPASMSTAAAREPVGQPFLRDHQLIESWPTDIHGPVHLIACQKGVTESQAIRQLGFPDAIVVSHPFGVYVADEVQKIQMAFIANCRDETTTTEGVQAFLSWLEDHGEVTYLLQRARHRRQIADFVRTVSLPAGAPPPVPKLPAHRKRR